MVRSFLFLCLVGISSCNFPQYFMNTLLDHYSGDRQTFNVRYWHNGEHAHGRNASPIFIYLTGLSAGNPAYIYAAESPVSMYAREFKAHLFMLEHRFFGQSIAPDQLGLLDKLTSQQALGDLVSFVQMLPTIIRGPLGKIVVFGFRDAGKLAIWSRSISSVPIFAAVASGAHMEARLEYADLFPAIKDQITRVSPACARSVAKGFAAIQESLKSEPGREELKRLFNTCEAPTETNNTYFWMTVYYPYQFAVEADGAQGASSIQQFVCNIHASQDNILTKMHNVHMAWRQRAQKQICTTIDHFKKRTQLRLTHFGTAYSDEKACLWLQCNEIGTFPTTRRTGKFFGSADNVKLSDFIETCQVVFSPHFTQQYISARINQIASTYGTRNQIRQRYSRIIALYGSNAPWRSLQLSTSNEQRQVYVHNIQGVSEFADFHSITNTDYQSVVNARAKIINWLHTMLD